MSNKRVAKKYNIYNQLNSNILFLSQTDNRNIIREIISISCSRHLKNVVIDLSIDPSLHSY